MAIAVFGRKVFEVTDSKIYTPADLQYGTTLDTEKQDAKGKKPSTYNKGPTLNSFGMTVKLDASLGVNPRRELEDWESVKDAATAYPFVLGSKPLGANKWLLVEVQASNLVVDNAGNILAADLQLKFDEWVRPGSASASSGAGASKARSGGSSSGKVGVGLRPSDYGGLSRVGRANDIYYGNKSGLKLSNSEMNRAAWLALKE